MTETELMKQVESLEQQIADLKKEIRHAKDIGFEDDEIFLLSSDEYETYKDVIPSTYFIYWLRNSLDKKESPRVGIDGNIIDSHDYLSCEYGVRPVIKLSEYYNDPIGTLVTAYNFPWVCIDSEKHLYIAEVPLAVTSFDTHYRYNYKDSDIRKFLKEWVKNR